MIVENRADVAVFFDFENIAYSLRQEFNENPNFEALMDKCQEYGRVVMARAYANWSRHTPVIPPLQASGFDPVYVPSYFYNNQETVTRKNAVDIHLAIEAIELVHTRPHVTVFVILTGDKDFIPLANALRRYGKQVVALGVKGTTSPYLQQAVDDFIFYHQILDDDVAEKREDENIYDVLVRVVKQLASQKQDPVLPRVKHSMGELLDGFDETQHKAASGRPFRKFKDFILEAQRLGYVQLKTTGTVNMVYLPGTVPEAEPVKEPPREQPKEEKKTAVSPPPPAPAPNQPFTLDEAFDLLVKAIQKSRAENKSLRAGSIKGVIRSMEPAFNEKLLDNGTGEKFTHFTEFARAAQTKGLVRLQGKGVQTEIHLGRAANGEEKGEKKRPFGQVHVRQLADVAPAKAEAGFEGDEVEIPEPTVESVVEAVPDVEPLAEPVAELVAEPIVPVDEQPTAEHALDGVVEQAATATDLTPATFFLKALRRYEYPAELSELIRHCLRLRDEEGVAVSNFELRQLLGVAAQAGLVRRIEADKGAKVVLQFDENETAVSRYLTAVAAEGAAG